jgi:hypothetical protein
MKRPFRRELSQKPGLGMVLTGIGWLPSLLEVSGLWNVVTRRRMQAEGDEA